jgi:AraC-like DNA-binding protein
LDFSEMPASHFDDSLSVLADRLGSILGAWQTAPPTVHLPAPRGLGGDHDWQHFHVWPEIFLQLGGSTEFRFPQERLRLQPGELLVIPRLLPHHELNRDGAEAFANLVIMPQGNETGLHVAQLAERGRAHVDKHSPRRIRSERMGTVIACLDECAHLQHGGGSHRDGAARELLRAALLSLEAIVLDHRLGGELPRSRSEQCCDLIEINLTSSRLGVPELARWLDCHPDHLSACFRRERGCTITEHITARRIGLARRLLRETDLRIAQIAWACGFQDPAYFSRRFRQVTGDPPQAFRRHAG